MDALEVLEITTESNTVPPSPTSPISALPYGKTLSYVKCKTISIVSSYLKFKLSD